MVRIKIYNKNNKFLLTIGYFGKDKFVFENELGHSSSKHMKHTFGCATTETGEFYNQEVDGIIGFGSNTYSITKADPPNILQTERLEGRIKSLVFSLCLGHNGGEMSFGDWNKYLHLDQDSKLKKEESNPNRVKADNVNLHEDHRFILTNSFQEEDPWRFQYKVPLLGIDFDGERITYPYAKMNSGELNSEGAFFDSGTTYMYTSHMMFRKIKKRFDKFCDKSAKNCGGESRWEECYSIDDEHMEDLDNYFRSFPMFTFHFGGNKPYRWYPSDYLIKNGDLDQYCVGIKPLKDMILGAVFMRNYDILFDKTRRLIGFSRSDCNGTGKVHYYDENGDDILKKVPLVTSKDKAKKASLSAKLSQKHLKRHKSKHTKHIKEESNENKYSIFYLLLLISVFLLIIGVFFKYLVSKLKNKEKIKKIEEVDNTIVQSEEDLKAEAVIVEKDIKDVGASHKGKKE